MSTLSSSLVFLVQTLGNLYIMAVLLRFLLQAAKADFYNPISQAIVKITSPLLNPVRKLIPRFVGIDASSLVLALILQLLLFYLLWAIKGVYPMSIPFPAILIACLVELTTQVLNIYLFSLVIIAIASWITQGNINPGLVLLIQLTNPLTNRVRKIIPPMGGLDFSMMVILIIIYFLKNLLAIISS